MRDPIPMGMTPRDETANLTPSFADHAATRRDSVVHWGFRIRACRKDGTRWSRGGGRGLKVSRQVGWRVPEG